MGCDLLLTSANLDKCADEHPTKKQNPKNRKCRSFVLASGENNSLGNAIYRRASSSKCKPHPKPSQPGLLWMRVSLDLANNPPPEINRGEWQADNYREYNQNYINGAHIFVMCE